MRDLQAWLMLHSHDVTGNFRSPAVIIVIGVALLVIVALLVERQRPSRRVARARHSETIPTWGDLYLESLAEAHRKPRRIHRGRISTP